MPELRKDPISGRWVIISTERSKRPNDFASDDDGQLDAFEAMCPFDEGKEAETRPEILSVRNNGSAENSSGWLARVIPSEHPLLQVEGELGRMGVGMFDMMNGIGAHELIIETSRHREHFPQMSDEQLGHVLLAYRDRMVDLFQDKRIKYVLIFKNHKINPEFSFHHCISQLIALPILPKQFKEEMSGAKEYYDFRDRCLYCDIVRQELKEGIRVVDESRYFLMACPYASRGPFEVNIIPKVHKSSYTSVSRDEVADLTRILKRYLKRIYSALGDPPYNLMLHTAPSYISSQAGSTRMDEDFHWHIEILPTLTKLAGFEWGSGFYINPTSPEAAAEFLRNIEDS